MFGAVDAWLYAYLAGIRPTDVGFSKVMIQPVIPKQLTFAEAVLDTCKGCFYVKWKKQYGKLALFVEIPFGAQAEIRLCGEIHHVSSGSYHFCSTSQKECICESRRILYEYEQIAKIYSAFLYFSGIDDSANCKCSCL